MSAATSTGIFLQMARTQWKIVATRPMNVATGVVTPLLFLSLLVLPRIERLDAVSATEVLSGVLLASLWSASLWSGAGIIRRERWAGTLGSSLTGQLGPTAVIVGKTVGGVIFDATLILMSSSAFLLLLGVPVRVDSKVALGIGLAAVVLCGVASSLMVGALLVLSRHAFQLTAALGTPILLIGGTLVPLRYLPDWVSWISALLNVSWLQRFLTSTTTDNPAWTSLAVAAGLSTVYAFVGARALGVLLRRAKKEATLELV